MHTILMSMQAHIGQLTIRPSHIRILPELKSWILKSNFPYISFSFLEISVEVNWHCDMIHRPFRKKQTAVESCETERALGWEPWIRPAVY